MEWENISMIDVIRADKMISDYQLPWTEQIKLWEQYFSPSCSLSVVLESDFSFPLLRKKNKKNKNENNFLIHQFPSSKCADRR
jgi:hypothetical protein